MPMAASSSATAAKIPSSSRAKRRSAERPGDDLVHGADAVHRDVGIQLFYFLADGLPEILHITLAAQKNHRVLRRELAERDVDVRHVRGFEAVGFHIADDADDGQALQARAKSKFNLLAERVLVRPVAAREGLVNHCDSLRFEDV